MAISAKELAQKLDISAATVSMVLNNKPGISKRTRDLVMTAAREYGYDFSKKEDLNVIKGSMQFILYKKHGTIVSDTPFFLQLTEGIDMACKKYGYSLQISYIYGDQPLEQQLSAITASGCAGMLLLGTEMEADDLPLLDKLSVPLIVLDSYFEELKCDTVLINNVQGAFLATSHLIKSTHTLPGYLHSSYSIGNFEERQEGYHKALRTFRNAPVSPIVHSLTPSVEGAYSDMMRLLASGTAVASAYFADNDLIAAGAVRAFREMGYRIPADIAVIGFDDMPICEYVVPALSTMRVPKREMGILAVERLIARLAQPTAVHTKTEISTLLIKRESA